MENSKETVCAVVVAYNRKELLIECLEALRKQTRPIQAIYLIDNASTDGTPELLLEKGYIKELLPKDLKEPWEKEFEINNLTNGESIKIHYVRMHENTGGAGGFYEGVKRGYEKGYDWLWLMDDDVKADINCLKNLLKYKEFSKVMYPSKLDFDGSEWLWEPIFDPVSGSISLLNNFSFKCGKKYTFVNAGSFEGMLIKKDIINKIGFPDKRFFIVFDDAIYGFYASLYANSIYIKDALLYKLKPHGEKIKNEKMFFYKGSDISFYYYSVRNYFLIYEHLKKLDFFFKDKFIWHFLGFVIYRFYYALFKDVSIKNFLLVLKGLYDGFRKKFGKIND